MILANRFTANVPVSPGGVASFDVSASASGGDPAISLDATKGPEIVIESAHWTNHSLCIVDGVELDTPTIAQMMPMKIKR